MTTLVPTFLGGTGVDATSDTVTFTNGLKINFLHVEQTAGTLPGSSTNGIVVQKNASTSDIAVISLIGGAAADSRVEFGDAGDRDIGMIRYTHGDNAMEFYTNASEQMTITSAGIVVIGHTASVITSSALQASLQIMGTAYNDSSISAMRWSADANGATINLGKSRNGTIGSNTVVNDGDELGKIDFSGDDGTDYQTLSGRISSVVNGTPGTGDIPADLVFSSGDGGSVAEVLRLAGTGLAASFTGDVNLKHDGAILRFGDGLDVTQTHVHDVGLDWESSRSGADSIFRFKNIANASASDIRLILQNGGTSGGDVIINLDGQATGAQFTMGVDTSADKFVIADADKGGFDGNDEIFTLADGGAATFIGNVSAGPGGTGTDKIVIEADGGSGAAGGGVFEVRSNGTFRGGLGNKAALAGSGTSTDLELRAASGIPITFAPNNTNALTLDTSGNAGFAGNIVIPDAGTIGSVSDTDAIAISSGGDVTLTQDLTVTGSITGGSTSVTQKAGLAPVGSIIAYGSTTVPTGWLACDDSAVSRTTFSVLFAVLGTSYGSGNGSTTFNVPDLRDRMVMGKGTNNSTMGASSTGASGSFVVATASGSASLTKTTGTFATSAKDSSQASALTNVTAGGHTHNVTMPAQVCMYIIKA